MFEKPERAVTRVFIHCSASDNPNHDNVATLRKWHVDENKWSDIGYHYFITKDGVLHECRPLEKKPAAQGKHNPKTIAICVSGLSDFNEKQFAKLKELCGAIDLAYNKAVTFHGHREVAAKECPVFDYKSVLNLDEKGRILEKKEIVMTDEVKPVEVKSGVKTTEFWSSVVTTVVAAGVTIANEAWGWGLDATDIMAFLSPVLAYIFGRPIVKAVSAK